MFSYPHKRVLQKKHFVKRFWVKVEKTLMSRFLFYKIRRLSLKKILYFSVVFVTAFNTVQRPQMDQKGFHFQTNNRIPSEIRLNTRYYRNKIIKHNFSYNNVHDFV